MTKMTVDDDDILTLVVEEIRNAQKAAIPPLDLPDYVADRLRLRVEGCYQYVRKRRMSPGKRAADIRERFDGANEKELAKEHGITTRRVQQIVNGK